MAVRCGDVLEVDATFLDGNGSLPAARRPGSGLTALFDADLLRFGAFDLTPWGEALVAQHTQGFDFGTLATAFAVFQDFEVAGAGHAIFIDRFFPFRHRSPEYQQLADMLNWRGAKFVGQGMKHGFACGPIIREDTNLDQPVRVQGGIGFLFNRGGEPVTTNHDHRVKVMRFRAVFFALGGGQLNLRHGYIIGEEGKNEIPN